MASIHVTMNSNPNISKAADACSGPSSQKFTVSIDLAQINLSMEFLGRMEKLISRP